MLQLFPKRPGAWFKSNSNNKTPIGMQGVLCVGDLGKSWSKCDCVYCDLVGRALSPGVGPDDLQRSFPTEIILWFNVGIWIHACCLSGRHFCATERMSVEIKRLMNVAIAWYGKQVKKTIDRTKLNRLLPSCQWMGQAVSSPQGFQLGPGFWLELYLLLDDKILAGITADLFFLCALMEIAVFQLRLWHCDLFCLWSSDTSVSCFAFWCLVLM